ncbi:hypothetical protein GQ600_16276 [Phytophthora cactorum]|nr:hypothetical protein GQ600_16276 [Phytophthora cactorum]
MAESAWTTCRAAHTIPIRQAVGRGDVNGFTGTNSSCTTPICSTWRVQKEQLDAARWLSKHGFKITSLSLIEEAGRKEMVPMLRWLVEHGPPLNFGTAMKLTVEYFHNEIAWWVSESDRVQIVLEALQKEKQDVLGWILTRTRFENVSSQQRIRDAIQRAPESIILRIEEDLSDLEECKWCFLPTNKEALQRNGAGIFKKKARRRSVKDAAIDIVLFTPGFDNLGSIKVEANNNKILSQSPLAVCFSPNVPAPADTARSSSCCS